MVKILLTEKDQAQYAERWFASLSQKDKIKFLTEATKLTHEPLLLDKVNQKMIKPVEGLIIDGLQYYEFVSTADMPQARFIHFNHFRQELAQGMDTTLLNKYLDEMATANNKQDSSYVGALIYMAKDTVNNCTPLEVLYNLATLVYFEKNEDISCYDSDYNNRKKQLFKSYPNQAFFLTRLLEKGLKNVGKDSPEDIAKYLRVSAVKLKAYQQMLFDRSGNGTSEPSKGT